MNPERRSMLATLGLAFPWAIPFRGTAQAPAIRWRSLEDSVRSAFADRSESVSEARRVEVGWPEGGLEGIQGCTNDRPFAGFATGRLKIIRVGCEPGPSVGRVRLFVGTLDIALDHGTPARPLDYSRIPPAAELTDSSFAASPRDSGKPKPAGL